MASAVSPSNLDLVSGYRLQALPFDAMMTTKYLTKPQREAINRQQVTRQEFEQYATLLNCPEGMRTIAADVSNYSKYPVLALHALADKKITPEQFATQCMVYEAIDQMIANPARYEARMNYKENRWDYYKINYPSLDIPALGFTTYSIHQMGAKERQYLKDFFPADDETIDRLIEELRNAPRSEGYFWAFELPLGPLASWSPLYHRLSVVSAMFFAVNAFSTFKGPLGPMQPQLLIVPSYTILKTYLRILFPECSIDLQPVLGEVTEEIITENKMQGIRVINIGMPGADIPEIADGWNAGKIIYTIHDFYHGGRDGMAPDYYHRAIRRINSILERVLATQPMSDAERAAVKRIKWKMMDGEIFEFGGVDPITSLGLISHFGAIFKKYRWPKVALEAIKKDMDENRTLWREEFKISQLDYDTLVLQINSFGVV